MQLEREAKDVATALRQMLTTQVNQAEALKDQMQQQVERYKGETLVLQYDVEKAQQDLAAAQDCLHTEREDC